MSQVGQIRIKCAEMLAVQVQGRVSQSPLMVEVGRKPRNSIRERLASRQATGTTDESGNGDLQHLLDRNARVTSHLRWPVRCPPSTGSVNPELQKRLQMAG
jgi:hypothetical protein